MKVHAIERLCIAAGRCMAVADDIFELDEDGFVIEGIVEVPEDREEAVRQAAVLCPSKALVILEDDD
ncbi:ferredoxin [Granulicoccus sp. GXG6511]|uniref:ferredoxin n=1 Tax=Granulicoccus sp. GXG6511 TaxID=3381351 RepID=UPI003D7DF812